LGEKRPAQKDPRARHRGTAEGCQANFGILSIVPSKFAPSTKDRISNDRRLTEDIGIRVYGGCRRFPARLCEFPAGLENFPAPARRIRCPLAQGICRNRLMQLRQFCRNHGRHVRSGKISLRKFPAAGNCVGEGCDLQTFSWLSSPGLTGRSSNHKLCQMGVDRIQVVIFFPTWRARSPIEMLGVTGSPGQAGRWQS
jgi:hypothetical protein